MDKTYMYKAPQIVLHDLHLKYHKLYKISYDWFMI